jgi:hypothetical protein
VFEELKALMGGQQAELVQPKYGPAVVLMAGLQVGGQLPLTRLKRQTGLWLWNSKQICAQCGS